MEPYEEKYRQGKPLDEIVKDAAAEAKEAYDLGRTYPIDGLHDFSRIKDQVEPVLINARANRELLRDIPHERLEDLAVAFYSYRNDLERYSEKVRRIRNERRRAQAEDCLEQLKRALDRAEGLDVLFDRYMTERRGKYIIFCANFEAMQEDIGKVKEWFGLIDDEPNVYSSYTEDPEASESFKNFREDKDESHLKLLFCIDALNEGVHVENVSGVILLRPTVSPVVYKQQIGRALSASKQTNPVIFDVVNNIENLYSIDAVKEEMEEALSFMRNSGSEQEIANETFEVTGELKDCLRLFHAMEGALTASWDAMYLEAKRYYETYGNLLPVMAYETEWKARHFPRCAGRQADILL